MAWNPQVIQAFAQASDLIVPNTGRDIGCLGFLMIGHGRCEACQASAIQQGETQRIPPLVKVVQQCQKLTGPGSLEHLRKTIGHARKMTKFGCENAFLSTQDEQSTHLVEARFQASVSTGSIGAIQPPTDNGPQ
ncbi:hypothetical protein [Delftia acidovorans]|uniref:hypothetical protein n=1 Tax=Delftia acidovorans TaxID=80866 RepID=UPI0035A15651